MKGLGLNMIEKNCEIIKELNSLVYEKENLKNELIELKENCKIKPVVCNTFDSLKSIFFKENLENLSSKKNMKFFD
jgi:hypothetical protein